MSKYTSGDVEVLSLDMGDRINFEFDMLNHDVDRNVELSYGTSALKDRSSIKESFKDWKKLGTVFIMILSGILTFVVIVLVIVYVVLYMMGEKPDTRQTMAHVAFSAVLLFVVIGIIYYIFGKMQTEAMKLGTMLKKKPASEVAPNP